MGKGIVFYLISNIFMIIGGFAIHIGLGRFLGPARYGIFGVIFSLITLSENFFNTGMIRSVAKHIAAKEAGAFSILKAGTMIQLYFSLALTVIVFFCADLIAGLLRDSSFATFIRFGTIIIIPMSIYKIRTAYLNGTKRFVQHSIVEIVYSLGKVFFVFAFVLMGFEIKGAIGGYAAAACAAIVVTLFYIRPSGTVDDFSYKIIVKFAIPIMIYAALFSFLMSMDVLFIKAMLKNDQLAGFYTAAVNISRILWALASAFGSVLLPVISNAMAKNDLALVKKYIQSGIRYMLLLLFPLAVIVHATAGKTIVLLYSKAYLPAESSLCVLIYGYVFLTLFSILCIVITAVGKPKVATVIIAVLIPVNSFLSWTFIANMGIKGAAAALLSSSVIGVFLCYIFLFRLCNARFPVATLIRLAVVGLVIFSIISRLDVAGFRLFLLYGVVFAGYMILLGALKEFNSEDADQIISLFKVRKTGAPV